MAAFTNLINVKEYQEYGFTKKGRNSKGRITEDRISQKAKSQET
jgi:hypothetical protein